MGVGDGGGGNETFVMHNIGTSEVNGLEKMYAVGDGEMGRCMKVGIECPSVILQYECLLVLTTRGL